MPGHDGFGGFRRNSGEAGNFRNPVVHGGIDLAFGHPDGCLRFRDRYANLGSAFPGEFGCSRQFASDDGDHALDTVLSVIMQEMAACDPARILPANKR